MSESSPLQEERSCPCARLLMESWEAQGSDCSALKREGLLSFADFGNLEPYERGKNYICVQRLRLVEWQAGVTITILSARNLPKADIFGKCDPFVELYFEGETKVMCLALEASSSPLS